MILPFKLSKIAKEVIKLSKDEKQQKKLMMAALDNTGKFHIDNVGKHRVRFFNKELNVE